MRSVFMLVLAAGVGLAGFAVYMAKGLFGDYQAALAQERAARGAVIQTTDVFVANEQVRYGSRITEENVRLVKWPSESLPEGTFTTMAALFPEGQQRFRTALRTIEKNEALLAVKVTEPGADAGVASRLGNGMRAFAIRVDPTSGVSGHLAPGDHVDIYWTGQIGDGREGGNSVTKLIESSVRLLAIDQTADIDYTAPTLARTVTVEVTREQGGRLTLAQNSGKLTLSLVGHGDTSVAEEFEIDQNELLGIVEEEIAIAEPVAPQMCTIRTRKGGELVEVPIPCPIN